MDAFQFNRVGFDPQMLADYVELFAACFPGNKKLTVEYLRWLYALSPDGSAIGHDAFADGRLAAHYVVVPVNFSSAQGQVIKGCWSLNTATHPDFQGKGLFVKLAEATYATAHGEGCGFVVGVANQNSTHGFVRRLGFANLGQLSTEVGYFPAKLAADGIGWARHWNSSTMSWRLKNPSARYRVQRGSRATTVYRPLRNGFVNVDLGDFPNDWFEQSDQTAIGQLLPSVRVSFGGQPRGLSIRIPNRMLPSPWNVIVRQLSPALSLDPSKIVVRGLDLDTF
jgi:GNAT superfamily N-acetyltransferase